jgi:hypothetical protein
VFYPLIRVLCESSEVVYIIVALAEITPAYNLITVGIETATFGILVQCSVGVKSVLVGDILELILVPSLYYNW